MDYRYISLSRQPFCLYYTDLFLILHAYEKEH